MVPGMGSAWPPPAAHAALPPSSPSTPQIWNFARSADARDTEGGASKRSLVEQVAKMRAYLASTA